MVGGCKPLRGNYKKLGIQPYILKKRDKQRKVKLKYSWIRECFIAKSRIGLTMRQPFLGKLEWIWEDLKRLEEAKASG